MKKNDNQEKSGSVLRKLGVLLINFALFYALLRLIITAAERFDSPWIYYIGTTLYLLFGGGCFVAFYVLNGFTENSPSEKPRQNSLFISFFQCWSRLP